MQLGILNDTCVEHARVYSRATVPMIDQAAARQGQSTQLTEHSPLGADQASNKERQQAVWDRAAVDRLSVTYRMRSIPPWFAVGYRTSREIPVYIHRTRGARLPSGKRKEGAARLARDVMRPRRWSRTTDGRVGDVPPTQEARRLASKLERTQYMQESRGGAAGRSNEWKKTRGKASARLHGWAPVQKEPIYSTRSPIEVLWYYTLFVPATNSVPVAGKAGGVRGSTCAAVNTSKENSGGG